MHQPPTCCHGCIQSAYVKHAIYEYSWVPGTSLSTSPGGLLLVDSASGQLSGPRLDCCGTPYYLSSGPHLSGKAAEVAVASPWARVHAAPQAGPHHCAFVAGILLLQQSAAVPCSHSHSPPKLCTHPHCILLHTYVPTARPESCTRSATVAESTTTPL
jgi:hypothetical protein